MKNYIILVIFCAMLFSSFSKSQLADPSYEVVKSKTRLSSHFKLNFAVPDIPAFKALDTSPSEILRPSTPEALSIITSKFLDGNNLVLPRSIALEIAPMILWNHNKITLDDYRKNDVLYSLRISVATLENDSFGTTAAIGIRLSLIDKGDLKKDEKFINTLFGHLRTLNTSRNKYLDEYEARFGYTGEQLEQHKEDANKYADEQIDQMFDEKIEQVIEEEKTKYKEDNWNAEKLDLAFAITGQSPDSLVGHLVYHRTSFWLSYGLPVNTWGQLLLGGTMSYLDTASQLYSQSTLNARLYGGVNRIKGFIEFQYGYDQTVNSSTFLYNLGTEMSVMDGIWINLSVGGQRTNGTDNSTLVTHFDLRYTLPENFKLF